MNKKYALCVGNNYPGTSAALSGCVNDALDWSDLLAEEGYDVQMLLEGKKFDVLEQLRELVDRAGFADRIVFTYSGHGSWVPDRDGDEADGRDEVLVMADYRNGGIITDDELQDVFRNLKYGSGALIISDSCHSGTVSRFMPPDTPLSARPRFLSPINFVEGLSEERAIAMERSAPSHPRATASLISGSKDDEYSWDAWFNGRANGAFTKAAIDTYRHGIRLGTWHKSIREQLPTSQFPQAPQLTVATKYRKYTRAF